jgi:signal transduction histidine kinase
MATSYTLTRKDQTSAMFPVGKMTSGRFGASKATMAESPRLKSLWQLADSDRQAGAADSRHAKTGMTDRLADALAALVAWTAYQWRLGQTAASQESLFQERLDERATIAQDLHDTLLQGFVSASMQLHVADDQLPPDSPAKPMVGRVIDLMRQVAEDSRKTLRGLRSTWNLNDLEKAFARVPQELGGPPAADFTVIVEGRAQWLPPGICDQIYRIGREALANAFRHSEARRIEIEVEYGEKLLRVVVRDNGQGIDPQVLRTGRDGHWGLAGMRERAQKIGARLEVWTRKGSGTEVELSVPASMAYRSEPAGGGLTWLARWRPFQAGPNLQNREVE